jgi:peptidoglycan hydrolase-like protein with peptidoglycan-binding domain
MPERRLPAGVRAEAWTDPSPGRAGRPHELGLPAHPTAHVRRCDELLRLQRSHGNNHVQRLLRHGGMGIARVEASGLLGPANAETAPTASNQPLLRLGSAGPAVAALQSRLNDAGADPSLAPDGQFGPATRAAVVAFQQAHGLVPDGIVGPKTSEVLSGIAPAAVPDAEAGSADSTSGGNAVDSLLGPAGFGAETASTPTEAGDRPEQLPGLAPASFGPGPAQSAGGTADPGACEQGRSFVNTGSSSGLIGSIFFCTDKFDLDLDNDVPELQELKTYEPLLKRRKVKFVFLGFADVRGTDAHNQTLSENRAKSVEGFVRNLLQDHPNYEKEVQGLGRKTSIPGFLEGARRVDILAEPAVAPPPPKQTPVPGSKKSRDWSAQILGSGGAKLAGGFDLVIVDNTHHLQMKFVFKAAGVGVGTPASIQGSSSFFDFETSQNLEFHHFEGPGTWRSAQIQIGLGPSTDVVVLFGPPFNAGNEPVELRYEDLIGVGLGIGVSVMGGLLSRVDQTPSPFP